jgi:flavin reductase (DIM6/NTAB) family NADH-FMN oxidoreductase RutF
MPLPVSVWTAEQSGTRAGWTISSLMVADGNPAIVLGLLDEDSSLADLLSAGGKVAINLLRWSHRGLADAFAGAAPAPGGPFRLGSWRESEWGPVLIDAAGWIGGRLLDTSEHAGYALLVRAEVEHVEVSPDSADGVLGYFRGRYFALG